MCGLQSKLLITPLSECLKSVTTTLGILFSWLGILAALNNSYHIGEPRMISYSCLVLCCVDTMIM